MRKWLLSLSLSLLLLLFLQLIYAAVMVIVSVVVLNEGYERLSVSSSISPPCVFHHSVRLLVLLSVLQVKG